jgi:hypothetical protein
MGSCVSNPEALGGGDTSKAGKTKSNNVIQLGNTTPRPILSRESSLNTAHHAEKYKGIKPGLRLLSLDSFVSKYTHETMQKWRSVVVRVYDGSAKTTKMLVHFEGWSDKNDKWIDVESQAAQLCPFGIMPQSQIESGGDLTLQQQSIARKFMLTGVLTEPDNEDERQSQSPTMALESLTSDLDDVQSKFYKGLKVDVQDVFQRAGEQTPSKWRAAEVLELAGSKLRVHYLGLGHDFDEVIDISKDLNRVRERGQLSSYGVKKSRSVGAGRLLRRSFDSAHTGASSPLPWAGQSPQNEGTVVESGNGGELIATPSREKVDAYPDSPQVTQGTEDSPAFLLRNKATPAQNRSKRNASFSSKPGQVLANSGTVVQSPSQHRRHSTTGVEVGRRATTEIAFSDRMEDIGLHIVDIEPDGNCLFRATSHQLYCTEDRYAEFRNLCVQHMLLHRKRFEIFCTSDFDSYCRRMAQDGTWASELEIRALEEITDRVFSIYSSDCKDAKPKPMATNFDENLVLGIDVLMIKLTYHGNHYNSIFDQRTAFPLGERHSQKLLKHRMKLFDGT